MSNIVRKIGKIFVDRKACIGAATCVVEAPKAFDLDADGIAIVLESEKEVTDDKLLIAAQSCPVQAVILYDLDGNQVFPKV